MKGRSEELFMNHQQNKRLTVVMAVAVALFTMAGTQGRRCR